MVDDDDAHAHALRAQLRLLLLSTNEVFEFRSESERLLIGSGEHCDLRIEGPGVANEHALLLKLARPDRVEIEAIAEAQCVVGGVVLRKGVRRILVPDCEIRVASHSIVVAGPNHTNDPIGQSPSAPSLPTRELALRMAVAGSAETELGGLLGQVPVSNPRVIVVEGTDVDRGKSFELTTPSGAGTITIGRGAESSLRLEDTGTSRAHIEISFDSSEGIVLVKDLAATQGSFLGAKRLELRRNAVWTPDTMLRLGESTVLGLVLPLAVKKKTATFVADRKGAGTISAPKLMDERPVAIDDLHEESPRSALDEGPPVGAGGTSATIAAIEGDRLAEREPLYLRREPSGVRDRVILLGGMVLIVGLGISLIIWLFR